ncbi:MAG: GNAT family N-acetyltransferase [Rhizomicrobium sp.]
MPLAFSHRLARHDDIPALKSLMASAIRDLQRGFLTPDEIVASASIMGLDTQLIDDETYFIIESDKRIAGSGGWSRRATLFGGDHSKGRNAALLDPDNDAARVRAMYTNPDFARRGIGRMILAPCEEAAKANRFSRVELAATLAGEPLYRACGYEPIEHFKSDTPQGLRIPLIRMEKRSENYFSRLMQRAKRASSAIPRGK